MKKLLQVFVLTLFVLSAPVFAYANEPSIDISKMSTAEVNKLTKEQIADLSYVDLMAKVLLEDFKKQNRTIDQARAMLIVMIENQLSDLKFYMANIDGQQSTALEEAVRDFQKQNGKPDTGILTVEENDLLGQQDRKYKFSQIVIEPLAGDIVKDTASIYKVPANDFISAEGTWIMENDEIAYPLNTAKIYCDKHEGYCHETDAQIMGNTILDVGSHTYLQVDTNLWKIVKWDDNEVEAQQGGVAADPNCKNIATLTINPSANEVLEIDRNGSDKPCMFLGKEFPKRSEPIISKLVSGTKVQRDYYKKLSAEVNGYISKKYVTKMAPVLGVVQK